MCVPSYVHALVCMLCEKARLTLIAICLAREGTKGRHRTMTDVRVGWMEKNVEEEKANNVCMHGFLPYTSIQPT